LSSVSVGTFWWLSHKWRRGWRGIDRLHPISNCYTHLTQLGQTKWKNSMRLIQFKMWMLGISMGPTGTTRWDRCARARAKPHLGETDCLNSVWPISAKSKQRVGQANPVGPIAHFDESEIIAIGNREFAGPSRCDRDPYRCNRIAMVSGSGYVNWTRWRRMEHFGGAEFDFEFWTYVEMRKWLRVLEQYH
jgi:hypothetical protein